MANSTKKNPVVIVLGIVVVMTALFILAHSMRGVESSWDESNAIAALFEPVLRRMYNFALRVSAWAGHPLSLAYGSFVRKLAHFLEYFALGAECAAVTAYLTGRAVSPYIWTDLFVVLMVAVIDEFVQSLVGRTSLVADVLLDFSGALAGIFVALLVAAVVLRASRAPRRRRAA